jgi:regulatory protein
VPSDAAVHDPALHEAAVRLLARREHAAAELVAKLEQRGFAHTDAAAEVERLAADGLQSDERFTTLFVEQRVERGDGPMKVKAALNQRGVAAGQIDAALAAYEDEWPALARAALEHRFGGGVPVTRNERARRARFLQQRGFPAAIVGRATGFEQTDD